MTRKIICPVCGKVQYVNLEDSEGMFVCDSCTAECEVYERIIVKKIAREGAARIFSCLDQVGA